MNKLTLAALAATAALGLAACDSAPEDASTTVDASTTTVEPAPMPEATETMMPDASATPMPEDTATPAADATDAMSDTTTAQ